MQYLGSLGRYTHSLIGGARSRAPAAVHQLADVAEVGLGSLAAGYLAAKSNINGKGGKLLGLPIPITLGLAMGLLGAAGIAGSRSHDVMNFAKGAIGAQLAFQGIKLAYSGVGPSGSPLTNPLAGVVAALPGPAYMGYVPAGIGAVPNVESLLQKSGLMARPG